MCLALLASSVARAQDSTATKDASVGSLEGTVVKEPSGEGLRKALVEVIGQSQEESGNYTATSDQDGHFKVSSIRPGRYRIFVERTGYVEVDKKLRRSQGLVIDIQGGQELKDQTLHMLPAAIITGRVLDEDGDPMPSVDVTILRKRRVSFDPTGSAQTNDLGEYRIGGLLAGKYYVTASPQPNFESLVPPQKNPDDPLPTPPDMAYVTTFYPNVTDRSQAQPVELHPGDELPVQFSLTRRHTARIRGTVTHLAPGTKAAVILRSKDARPTFNMAEVDKDGKFELLHVAPGSYVISAATIEGDTPQSARQDLEITDANVDDLHLALLPGATIRGRVHMSGEPSKLNASTTVMLRSLENDDASDGVSFAINGMSGSPNLAKIKPDGSFELKNVPQGVYELGVFNSAENASDSFVESMVVGTNDVTESGLSISTGTVAVDLTVISGAGTIDGNVTNDKNEPVANAAVVALPEAKFRKQQSRYQKVETDQNGRFAIRGLRPGNYTLLALENLEEDDYFDPDFQKTYEGRGTAVKVEKRSHQNVALKIPPPDQP